MAPRFVIHTVMTGLVPAIHVFDAETDENRGCPAQGRHDEPLLYFSGVGTCTISFTCSSVSGSEMNWFLSASASTSSRPLTSSGHIVASGKYSSRALCI